MYIYLQLDLFYYLILLKKIVIIKKVFVFNNIFGVHLSHLENTLRQRTF